MPAPKNPASPRLRLVSGASPPGERAPEPAARAHAEHPDLPEEELPSDPVSRSAPRASRGLQQEAVRTPGSDSSEGLSSVAAAPSAPAFRSADGKASSAVTEALSDGQLVALARVEQRAAFAQLYRRHAQYLLSLTVRIQGNATDAEDIVHDAFMKVFSRLGDLRNGDSFRFWLAKVAANLARSRLRRRRLLGALGLSEADPIDLDLLAARDASPEQRVQLAQVYDALSDVGVDQRLAWVLRYVEGHKLEEVAELTSCSLATAKRRIASAQDRISLGHAPGGGQ